MVNVLRWIADGVRGRSPYRLAGHADDQFSAFEQIDAASLGIDDFRVSASMHIADSSLSDFAETLPACNYGAASLPDGRH